MKEKVFEIIASVCEKPAKKIKLEDNLISDLELESLDLIELVTKFESAFNVEIEDKDIKDFQTVEDIVTYVEAHVQDLH